MVDLPEPVEPTSATTTAAHDAWGTDDASPLAGRDPARCFNCDTAGPTRVGHVIPAERGGSDGGPLAARTVQYIRAVLRRALNQAAREVFRIELAGAPREHRQAHARVLEAVVEVHGQQPVDA